MCLGANVNACVLAQVHVSEFDHPLLCEGTRRQKGDLALKMLELYKDDECVLRLVGCVHFNVITATHSNLL